ncbi:DUF5133 domain-containing protein [Streptomyces sp. cmx-4-9]|uniref:DUF5133 domain-containing protein n=1 Tax=Streptomyces sp. cmx-4-9 TaxID=2790941 RepID=UPI00397F739E
MLLPSPILVHSLLRQYDSLLGQDSPAARRELADVTYTLCVSTATRTVEDAVLAARNLIEAAHAPLTGRRDASALVTLG